MLLKDFYMMVKYCKAYLVITVAFLLVSVVEKGNAFFMIYPMILTSMIPVTLLSYDERQKWSVCGQTFPYTRSQMVSVKYIIALASVLIVWVISAAVQLTERLACAQAGGNLWDTLLVMFFIGLATPAIMLPIIFRYGPEKGRILYYAVIVVLCAAYGAIVISGPAALIGVLSSGWPPAAVAAAGVVLFGLSWALSVVFYKRREI